MEFDNKKLVYFVLVCAAITLSACVSLVLGGCIYVLWNLVLVGVTPLNPLSYGQAVISALAVSAFIYILRRN